MSIESILLKQGRKVRALRVRHSWDRALKLYDSLDSDLRLDIFETHRKKLACKTGFTGMYFKCSPLTYKEQMIALMDCLRDADERSDHMHMINVRAMMARTVAEHKARRSYRLMAAE